MRRLYFLLPTPELAEAVVADLLAADVGEGSLHLIAGSGTRLESLPEGVQSTGPEHETGKGAALGGAVGLVAGLAAVALSGGVIVAGGTLAAMAAAGTGTGAIIGALAGRGAQDPEVRGFEEAIQRGESLLFVDVERERVEEIEERIEALHAEAKIAGTDPSGTFPRSGKPS